MSTSSFSINELDGIIDIEIEDEDVDTVAGLLTKVIGKVLGWKAWVAFTV